MFDMYKNNTNYHDELESITREVRAVCDKHHDINKETHELEEAEQLMQQACQRQRSILEELNHYWQGPRANRLIAEAFEENNRDLNTTMLSLDEKRHALAQERNELYAREDELHAKSRLIQLKHEDEGRRSPWG